MSFPVPPLGPADAGPRPVPSDVTTAYQLWCAVLLLTVVNLAVSLFDMAGSRDELLDMMTAMAEDDAFAGVSTEQLESVVPMVIGLSGAFGLALVGLLYLVARQLLRGRNWARMLLTLLGVFMSLSALPTVFGIGVGDGPAAWLLAPVSIVQAVATVGAIVLMHRREANTFFLRLPER